MSAPTRDEPPFDDAPPPYGDDDAPPPYGEPVEPEMPKRESTPKREAATGGTASDGGDLWFTLMESYKNRLTPDKRAFIGMADGRLADGVLTVYCSTEVQKKMLDTPAVTLVLREVTEQSVGREISVRYTVGEPEDGKKRDKFQDLLRMGGKFDNFNIK